MSNISFENCKYRATAQAKTFNARDNVSQFIRWARKIAGVREVLMFESDDLILRKNEKNFILCLLEIARFGAKFGVSVPSIIQLEQEIEREIEEQEQTPIPAVQSEPAILPECTVETEVPRLLEHLSVVDEPRSTIEEEKEQIQQQSQEPIESLEKASYLHKTVSDGTEVSLFHH